MSATLTGAYVVLAGAAVSAGGFLLISRFIPDRWLVADSEAASALYAAIGMAYAILIAIAAIAVWEPRMDVENASDQEASNLVEAHRAANGLATHDRTEIQELITRYTAEVIEDEWPMLRDERTADPAVAGTFETLRGRADALQRGNGDEAAAVEWVSRRVADAAESRLLRLTNADEDLPPPLWPTLGLGGFISIVFLYLFGLDRTFPNGLMMATVGGMIALVLYVIYEMQYPFSGGMAIPPEAFQAALESMATGQGRPTSP